MRKLFSFIKRISAKSISIVSFILSVAGVLIALKTLNLSQKQFAVAQIPYWDMQMNYSENNKDLISIKFNSITPGVILQGLEIITPSSENLLYDSVVVGNTWNCFEFSNLVYKYVEDNFKIPQIDFSTDLPLNIRYSIPVGIIFKYIQNGESKTSFNLYKVHTKIYSEGQFKISHLETKQINLNKDRLTYIKLVDNLNRDECLLSDILSKDTTILPKLVNNSVYYFHLNDLLETTKNMSAKLLVDSCGCISDTNDITLPLFALSPPHQKIFVSNLKIVKRHLQEFPKGIRKNILKLEHLISENPLCENYNVTCIRETRWVTKQVGSKLNEITSDIIWEQAKLLAD
ncbi:hypothetical protein WJU16_18090 [Chitinophaga pollutisoli]|uniref:Uncharacterized protein n=1 Tax=Chitinophaga pollutisoli TaxID=3133966 RepID=A0ABZ2YL97_9BACT